MAPEVFNTVGQPARRISVRVVQPANADPAESARRLRAIADSGLAGTRRTQAVATAEAVSPQVTPGGLETRLGQAGRAHA